MKAAESKYIELKNEALMLDLIEQLKAKPNSVDWGHVGSLQHTVDLLKEVLQFSKGQKQIFPKDGK